MHYCILYCDAFLGLCELTNLNNEGKGKLGDEIQIRVPIKIFAIVFLITQAIAYGLNIGFLKVYVSIDNGNGTSYSLASTVIPIILAFLIDFIYQSFIGRNSNKE